ncbi:NTP transferase domain-containing protein [Candidatus Peregrinibacteria bacterium]|nr:NTP transferase domain-containing protein [Candidatus Peregrinibacteria bacterium]
MKGIILAGGSGTRLHPITKVTSKQLLPVYNQPMIYFPLQTLLTAGIRDILIIVAPDHSGDFVNLLGSGRQFGARFAYEVQDKPEGLAQAFLIGEDFIGKDDAAMILGDNIFTHDFSASVKSFRYGAKIFVKQVPDAKRFGVVEFDDKGKVISIEEKPEIPKTNYAQTGFYLYDKYVTDYVKTLKPSKRGELEIVDLNKIYLEKGQLTAELIQGDWIDAGTFESLYKASTIVRENDLGIDLETPPTVKVEIKEVKKPLAM